MLNRKNKIIALVASGVVLASVGAGILLNNNQKGDELSRENETEQNEVDEIEEEEEVLEEDIAEESVEEVDSQDVDENAVASNSQEVKASSGNTSSTTTNTQQSTQSSNTSTQTNTSNSQNNTETTVKPPVNEEVKEETVVPEPEVSTPKYKDGSYIGSAQGYGGAMEVKVTISEGNIRGVSVISHNETEIFFEKVGDLIPAKIVAAQDANVDIVSGATYTSNGIINAVKNALSKA